MENKVNKKDIERLLEDTNSLIIAADNGVAFCGDMLNILYKLTKIIKHIPTIGCPKELLEYVIEWGLNELDADNKKATKFNKASREEFKKFLNDIVDILGE